MNIFDHLVLILSVILLVCVQVVTVVVYFCYMIDLQANALNSVTKVASSWSDYTVFQKNGHPFYFFHNSLKWWSIYTKFLPGVAEEMLIQNVWTKYGC